MSLSTVTSPEHDGVGHALDDIVRDYQQRGDVPQLLQRVSVLAAASPTSALAHAVEQYLEMHEIAGPIYEVIVEREPQNARALVVLANAYWLTGRGPDVVAALASRALASDPTNRAAWHLWALTEPSPRARVQRWQHVSARFPDDELASANLADNAAALAGAEDDPVALKLAITTYESLRATASRPEQVAALDNALRTLRNLRR